MWVEILLDKYLTYRPTERLLASWRLGDLHLAAGTVTDGLQRLELLLRPIYEGLRNRPATEQAGHKIWAERVGVGAAVAYGEE